MTKLRKFLVCGTSLLGLCAAPAFAQDANTQAQQPQPASQADATAPATTEPAATEPVAAPETATQQGGLQDIVVTARRVNESIQNTPVAVTAISDLQMARANVQGTEGLSALTPSLQVAGNAPNTGNPAAAQIFIRGIGQSDTTPGVDPGVGMYIDDVYLGSSVGGVMDFRDISNVQILRGPQGTLFGRNTIGGAILLTTRNPGATLAGEAQVGVGSDNLRDIRAAVDLPISDDLRTRWTFGSRTRDGYVFRVSDGLDLGDVNSYTVTGKVVWNPTSAFTLKLKGDYTREYSNGTTLVLARVNPTAAYVEKVSFEAGCPGMTGPTSPVTQINDPRCYNNFYAKGPNQTASTYPLGSRLENWGVQANMEYQVAEPLTLKSITAYRSLVWSGNRDADGSPFPSTQSSASGDGWQVSQELQALVKTGPLTLVTGLYYFRIKTDFKFLSILNPLTRPAPIGGPTPPGGTFSHLDGVYDNSNWAAFTQGTVDLTSSLQVTGGIRYTEETKKFLPNQYLEGFYDRPFVPGAQNSLKSNATTGTASVQYRWSREVMTYASWTRGYKAGGWNRSYTTLVPAATNFRPEYASSYELGAKFDIARKIRFNVAAFETKYRDMQLLYRVGVVPTIVNAGRATIKGAEGELTFAPDQNWLFTGNVSYLENSLDRVAVVPGASTAVTTANKLPYIPKWQGQAAVQYTYELTADWDMVPRASMIFTGAQFFEIGNSPVVSQRDDIVTFDLGLSFENSGDNWAVRLAARNVADRIYPVSGNAAYTTPGGYDEIAYNRGREWTVSVTKRF